MLLFYCCHSLMNCPFLNLKQPYFEKRRIDGKVIHIFSTGGGDSGNLSLSRTASELIMLSEHWSGTTEEKSPTGILLNFTSTKISSLKEYGKTDIELLLLCRQ